MTNLREIKKYVRQIAREFKPDKIVLFGSYAYGQPNQDSDVDLLVITPFRGTPHRMQVEIRNRFHAPFPMDLLARTPLQVRKRIRMQDWFMIEVLEKGKVLYETTHA